MKPTAPLLIVLTHDGKRCIVNLSQVEVIDARWQAAEITFASGTTLVVSETMETILAMTGARSRKRKRRARG
jgi:uncharacterized protein YlzI (FlbEa/FlbD family)